MFATDLTRLSEFSSFSLAKIVFGFYLCGLEARLHASEVTLLASVIASSLSSTMTPKTAYRIFILDNGVLLLLLKPVMLVYNPYNKFLSNFPCTLVDT